MPKIQNYFIKVGGGDLEQNFNITIHYNQEDKFYAEVPEGFWESCETLTEKEAAKLWLRRKYKYKYESGPYRFIIWSEREADVVDQMKIILELVIKRTTKKVPVIVVEFDNRGESKGRINRWPGDPDLPRVGLEMMATYCHQLNSGVGEAKYFKYWQSKKISEQGYETVRAEVRVDKRSTVIPDTPQNRMFLEDLHKALEILVDKLMEFAGSSSAEKLLDAISSKQKLLELNAEK